MRSWRLTGISSALTMRVLRHRGKMGSRHRMVNRARMGSRHRMASKIRMSSRHRADRTRQDSRASIIPAAMDIPAITRMHRRMLRFLRNRLHSLRLTEFRERLHRI